MGALPKPEGKVKMLSELKHRRPDPPAELYVYRIPSSFTDGDGFVTPNYLNPPEFLGFIPSDRDPREELKKQLYLKDLPSWVQVYPVDIEEFVEDLMEKTSDTEAELRGKLEDAREDLEQAKKDKADAETFSREMEEDDKRAAGVLKDLQEQLQDGVNQFEVDEILTHLAEGPYLGPGFLIAKVLQGLRDADPEVPE